jgi:hypothetical protein
MAEQWPFKPLVERSSRSTLTFCLIPKLVERPHRGEALSSRSTLTEFGAGTLIFCLIPKLVERPHRGEALSSRSTLTEFGAGTLTFYLIY